jgi:hypothetical protein
LKGSNGRLLSPKKSLYCFFEPQEYLPTHSYSPLLQRVTRVGTHAVSKGSKTTLWDRLSTHRGGNAGAGSHRSSIFRLHVGAALARRDPRLHIDTWSVGSVGTAEARRAELETEREVSRYIGETRILCLDIPDEAGPYSDRAFLERNAIGLLSRYNVLQGKANPEWLGTYSANVSIALSGLWNLNHLFLRPHTSFTSVLSRYVRSTLGKSPSPSQSIAPSNWYHQQNATDSPQLMLALDAPD